MDFPAVNEYMQKIHFTGNYDKLPEHEKETLVFTASELLSDEFGADKLTPRVVALQTLYMLEGESEEFAKLKRHGVKSYSVKGVSVSFDGTDIAPAVLKILKPSSSARVGRLI